MVKLNDWVQRTEFPLAGKEPFDWHEYSIAQVVRIDEECVEVDFACNCMTFDGSSSKLWYHEEYLPLDDKSYAKHKETHDACCLFGEKLELVLWKEESF